MTTAIDVLCPRYNMADFVYFRCTTCKYFAVHQPEAPDLVPRRLYNVMSPEPCTQDKDPGKGPYLLPPRIPAIRQHHTRRAPDRPR